MKVLVKNGSVKEVILAILLTGSFLSAKSQNTCLPDSIFRTDSLGNRKEKLAIPLVFNFQANTIYVHVEGNSNDSFMHFTIVEKLSCKWKEDFSNGKTSYKVSTSDKTATLNIIFENLGRKYIELLYAGSEERIFTITK